MKIATLAIIFISSVSMAQVADSPVTYSRSQSEAYREYTLPPDQRPENNPHCDCYSPNRLNKYDKTAFSRTHNPQPSTSHSKGVDGSGE